MIDWSVRFSYYVFVLFYDISLFFVILTTFLIPICILLGWSDKERSRQHISFSFILGSVFMLLAILLILLQTDTTDLQILLTTEFSERRYIFLRIAFFASFAIKVPMVPVHIWLLEAHVEAPTIDRKKIIAYSSVAHKNFVTIGMFSLNIQGIGGSILPILSQRVVSSALFPCVGVLYDRYKTRLVRYYGGLVSTMPNFSLIFFFFTLANMSLPGTSSFIGEFLILVAAFQRNSLVATLAALGMINKRFIWGNEIDQPLGVAFEPAGQKWDGALGCGLLCHLQAIEYSI
ncbi:hypothetical protein Cgig2_022420 (mitochondrion) [Carnegiea gigantea]|uniref:NADH-ubiquinone oxidoreductase chain 4 n=1 Tax=Carnegiea gigantea TaxID=171969 RepID=A0A9Q1JJA8_9CARY|nr:hypothetical protein Cgig2_022420 [Carnegiea gigantea]